jgi:RNA polymerase sigma factor (TIGR02999 family)
VAPPRTPGIAAGEVTRLLQAWGEGDATARDRLIAVVYAELRRRAAGHLRHERRGHTLRPTDLVHETYLRLCNQNAAWENRDQFFGVASRLMRRILVDHARSRAAAKRGGGLRVTLPEGVEASTPGEPDLLDLDAALDELAALDEPQARLVELRYFGGLTLEETARVLGSSAATVSRDWATAKAWLFRRLKNRPTPRAASPPAPGRRSSR